MRTPPSASFGSLASVAPLGGALALAILVAACGVVSADLAEVSGGGGGTPRGDDPLRDNGIDAGAPISTGPDANAKSGHPLCGDLATAECWPDDPRQEPICGNALAPVSDGGSEEEEPEAGAPGEDSGAEARPLACRVRASESGLKNQCVVAGNAGEGTACAVGEDCGAGFDCVREPGDKAGGGSCRAYCCEGLCAGATSNGSSGRYCDPALRVEDDTRVPACLPIRACRLLGKDECATNETCAVVREIDGSTGCVETGIAAVGAACDAEHCAAGLTCLGQVGTRTCFQLCSDSGAVCPAGQECTWAPPAFREAGVGVCTASSTQRAY